MLTLGKRRSERGSVLILIPAGLLVLVILAALAVDTAVYYLGQQQLHDALTAAANDSVTAGLNNRAFYGNGQVALDPASVDAVACNSIAAQNVSGLHHLQVSVALEGDAVHLVGQADVDAVFGKAIPGYGHRTVRASATAVVVNGPRFATPAGAASAAPVSCR
jgi:Flp pilus assembly protein TadG